MLRLYTSSKTNTSETTAKKPKVKTLGSIARAAFASQSLITKNKELQYAKEDVNTASLAYETYKQDKSPANFIKFQAAVEICAKNDRSGFKALNNALLKLSQQGVADEANNTKKNNP